MTRGATASTLCVLLLALAPVAKGQRSLTDSEYLLAQGATITVPTGQGNDDALRERLVLARSSIAALTESLAIANAEAEMFKRQNAELNLRLEALGIAGLDKDPGKIEQRLLAAVRELRAAKEQNEKALSQLIRLSESIQVLIRSAEKLDPNARLAVEAELRKTNEILGSPTGAATAEAVAATLTDAIVIDTKENLSLVVINVGEKQNTRVGMPFQVWRDGRRIGTIRVVDVRDRFSGAIIQSLESEDKPIKSGDRVKVDAQE
jgi:hypothetical protein